MFRCRITILERWNFSSHKAKRPMARTNLLGSCLSHTYPVPWNRFCFSACTEDQTPLVVPQRSVGVCNHNEKQKPPLLAEFGA